MEDSTCIKMPRIKTSNRKRYKLINLINNKCTFFIIFVVTFIFYLQEFRGMKLHIDFTVWNRDYTTLTPIRLKIPAFPNKQYHQHAEHNTNPNQVAEDSGFIKAEDFLVKHKHVADSDPSQEHKQLKNVVSDALDNLKVDSSQALISVMSSTEIINQQVLNKSFVATQQLDNSQQQDDFYLHKTQKPLILLSPTAQACLNNSLIFIVFSTTQHENMAKRTAIRETWGRESHVSTYDKHNYRTKVLFVVLDYDGHKDRLEKIKEENNKNNDIFLLNLSVIKPSSPQQKDIKQLLVTQFFMKKEILSFCPNSLLFVRTWDSTFWNVARLVGSIQGLNVSSAWMAGNVVGSEWIRRDPADPLYISKRQFDSFMFPQSLSSNPGYIISRSGIQKLLAASDKTALVWYKDMFFSGILRNNAGLVLESLDGLKVSKVLPISSCMYRTVTAADYLIPQELHEIWSNFLSTKHKCSYSVVSDYQGE